MNYQGELSLRLLSLYGAQIGLAAIFAFNFFYFSRVYSRSFLSKWSISWIGLFLFGIGMMYVTWPGFLELPTELKLIGTITHMIGGLLQASFLALGTYELVKHVHVEKQTSLLIGVITLITAVTLALIYAFDDARYTERYILRIGVRSLILGVVYITCGFFAIYSRRFGLESYGKRLLGIAFISYGLAQTGYFITVILVVNGIDASIILSVYGVIDLFLMTVMGLGMVMWLLEDERLKLKSTNADLDKFLYSTSHDLRAPIASVLGLAHVAKLETNDDKMISYFDMVESRVKKLDEVIGDILYYSKNNKQEVKKDKVDFNALLNEVVTDLKFNKGASKIRLIFDKETEHITICDTAQLKIILNNLLANAVKYHDLKKKNPFIEVVFEKRKGKVNITVNDNGAGIASDHLEKIFEMFYRASADSDGSGLGLFIVKEAAKKIGGEIKVSSIFREGSSFKLTYEELA